MTAPTDFTNILRFYCPACRAELSVPMTMAGIEGPCPSCCQNIRAPQPPAKPSPVETAPLRHGHTEKQPVQPPASTARSQQQNTSPRDTTPVFPPVREMQPAPPQQEQARAKQALRTAQPVVSSSSNGGFKARLSIPPADEPADDSWKVRHREQRRAARRSKRIESAAQSLLESRGFRIARLTLILASGAMLAWLLHYLQNHQWQFPGFAPAPTRDTASPDPESKVRPVADDANELMADDDTEIPPASGTIPAPTVSGGPPVSATPR